MDTSRTSMAPPASEILRERRVPLSGNNQWLDWSKVSAKPNGKFPFSISILSWALNEEDSIKEFLLRSKELMDEISDDYEHVLIDDGSTDRTAEIAEELKSIYPQLRIVRNQRNLGSGWNTRIAVSAARKDVLFWQTADWAYDISQMKNYVWLLREYDVVQGVRTNAYEGQNGRGILSTLKALKVSHRSDNRTKALISVINYLTLRTLFRIPLLDYQNVTVYPTKLAQSLVLESHSAFINPEMLFKAFWKGARIKQVRIGFHPRQKGEAKGTKPKVVILSVLQIYKYWFRWMILGMRKDKLKGQVVEL